MLQIPSMKEKAKKIYAYSDKNKSVPEIVYRFSHETCAIQVWPYLNFYYLDEDGTRTLRYATSDLNFEEKNFWEAMKCDDRYRIGKNDRFYKYWRKRRIHIQNNIREWMSYIPQELIEVFSQWNQKSPFIGRAFYYASRSKYYYQLCITNPTLAYLLLRKDEWNLDHPLYEKNPLDVVGEKLEVLSELFGFSRSHRKVLNKIPPRYWADKNLIESFQVFRKVLNKSKVLKLLQGVKKISYHSLNFILTLFWNEWMDRVEISFLNQISTLESDENQSEQILSVSAYNRFTRQGYKDNKRYIYFYDIGIVWKECMEFNTNWRIKTINSLFYHENLMIQQLDKMSEEAEVMNPIFFQLPPIPYQQWNQGNLFDNEAKMAVIPIKNSYELLVAGKKMENCAYSYKSMIVQKCFYCYMLKFESNENYMVGFEKFSVHQYE